MEDIEMEDASPPSVAGIVLVIDTNVLIDHLEVLDDFIVDVERQQLPVVLIIPEIVIDELDKLKNAPGKKGWFSRKASRWLTRRFAERKTVRVQVENETCLESGNWRKSDLVGTNNDYFICDCSRYFSRQYTTCLLSSDNLLRGRANGLNIPSLSAVAPSTTKWSSQKLAEAIFPHSIDKNTFQPYKGQSFKPESHLIAESSWEAGTAMEVDDALAITRVDARNSLHAQIVTHFTNLLVDLVGRVGAEEISRRQATKGPLSLSRYAPKWQKIEKPYAQWDVSDLLEYLDSKRRRNETSPRLSLFLSLPYTTRGARRGDEYSTQDWIVSLHGLKRLAVTWSDEPILESLFFLEGHLSTVFGIERFVLNSESLSDGWPPNRDL